MRHALRYSVPILLSGLLAISQADARGGGSGGHAGGGHAGVHVGFAHPGFVHQPVARFAHGFPNRGFARNRFQNGFQNGFGFWGWPVGDGDWGDWGSGYPAQPVQQAQDAPVQPEVIVIHTDGQGRVQTAQATPDVSYVKGCHAIPNGYHCDAQ